MSALRSFVVAVVAMSMIIQGYHVDVRQVPSTGVDPSGQIGGSVDAGGSVGTGGSVEAGGSAGTGGSAGNGGAVVPGSSGAVVDPASLLPANLLPFFPFPIGPLTTPAPGLIPPGTIVWPFPSLCLVCTQGFFGNAGTCCFFKGRCCVGGK